MIQKNTTMKSAIKIIVFVLWLSSVLARREKRGPKLVIDHDGGADDAMAIFIALLEEKYFMGPNVVGLTTVNGNVNESQVYINSQRILDVAERRDVPIYRGSADALVLGYSSDAYFGVDGLGDSKNVSYRAIKAEPLVAALALIEFSKKYEGQLIVVALAPLTNIALAIKIDPEFLTRLKQIYVGAGHVYDENTKTAEFNAKLDVEAYHIVAQYATSDKVTVVPFNRVRYSLNVTREWRVKQLGRINTKIMQEQNKFEQVSIPKSTLWRLLDPAVMSMALDNSIIEDIRLTDNGIILCGKMRGINTNNFTCDSGSNMKLVYDSNEDEYKNFLLRVFSADQNRIN
ncbi:inosine-uridine preferring nucleoside hydrolase-like isoform X2 [Ostrinia nubilalis]|uniref:inosine-uridine preferring nucleoside hydrolase-like isoform X2 n=2 Tax=Ostrinia nubilalis TaxID=29057 RepID=UPI0030824AF0